MLSRIDASEGSEHFHTLSASCLWWGYVSNSGWCGALSQRVKTASSKSQVYLYLTLFTFPPLMTTYSANSSLLPSVKDNLPFTVPAVLVLISKNISSLIIYWVPAQNCLCERSIRLLFALLEHPSDFPFLLLYVFEEFVFSCPVDVIVRVSEFTGLESRVKLFCLRSVPLLIFLKPFFVLSTAFLARVCSLVSAPISACLAISLFTSTDKEGITRHQIILLHQLY